MEWTDSLSTKGCHALLKEKGVDTTHAIEKKDLIALVKVHVADRSEADVILAEAVRRAMESAKFREDLPKTVSKPQHKAQATKDVDQVADDLIDMLLERPAEFKTVLCSQSAFKMIRGSESIVSMQVDILKGLAKSNRKMTKFVFAHGVKMSRTMSDAFKIVQYVTGGRGKYVVVLVTIAVTYLYIQITWSLTVSMVTFVTGSSGGTAQVSGLGDSSDLGLAEQVYAYSSSPREQLPEPLPHEDEWAEF
jgi:hypothetical protein